MTELDPILDAVRAEVRAYGVRRGTMTSVARRAGISRATLYRRSASFEELVQDALVSEFETMMRGSIHAGAGASSREELVTVTRSVLEKLATNAFVHALLEHDPELLLPYLVDRLGRSQELVLTQLEQAIIAAQATGSVRQGDPRLLALTVLQTLTPFVVSLRLLEGVAPRQVWFDEAVRLIEGYLRPEERHQP